ncbi:uncharacterized protein LOC108865062 [Galendromus occidentalis]|uniref:Uncharacterized protein LOC108865062 n=1 Tax=Galendromus occidentalis TaxID=34638 RepID=A0AAJ7L8J6_9ACAR|nr:uncharacterized protein LOC108865062 [Galendromus occidentalis]
MRPIAVGLDKLQAEKQAFYGTLLPTLYAVKERLAAVARTNLRYCRSIADGLLLSIETRFRDVFDSRSAQGEKSAIAALTMPSFKTSWFKCISSADQERILSRFKELIRDRLPVGCVYESEPSELTGRDDFYDFEDEPIGTPTTSSGSYPAEGAMQEYLRDTDTALAMLEKHPAIAAILREYNTQPPSSAEVERLFSLATIFNHSRANRLSDAKFEQRVLLRKAGCLDN